MRRLLLIACLVFAGCGGGGSSAPHEPGVASPSPVALTPVKSSAKNLTITIAYPTRDGASHKRATGASRHASYVPQNGSTIDLQFTGTQGSPTFQLTLGSADCPGSAGVYTCSIDVAPDSYTFQGQILDASGVTLATSVNVSPAAQVTVTGGSNSATLNLQGVVASVWVQMPLLCIDPASLQSNPIPLRFLDAQGQEIYGTFAYPVTVSTSNGSAALYPATSTGVSIAGTPVTGDSTVSTTSYPTTPGYEITGNGTEGYASLSATANSSALNVSYGTALSPDPASGQQTIYVSHHFLMAADPTQYNVNIYAILSSIVAKCDEVSTDLHNPGVGAIYADGSSDVVFAAGGNPSPPYYLEGAEFGLTPASYHVYLNYPTSPTVGTNLHYYASTDTVGTLSLARSATTKLIYLANTATSYVRVISDSTPTLYLATSYSTNTPSGFVLEQPDSIAVVNTTANGDVLFVPDASGSAGGTGGAGIITHADVPGSAVGSFTTLGASPAPVHVYSSSSYSNGSTQTISSTVVNGGGASYVYTFDATVTSPPFNATLTVGLPASGRGLTTGNGDTDFYLLTSTHGICYDPIANPITNPNGSCISGTASVSAIATSGDGLYVAAVNGTNLQVYTGSSHTLVPGNQTVGTGSVPVIYTR